MSGQEKYQKLLEFIESSWAELTVPGSEDTDTHYGLPHSFVAPSVHRVEGFVFKEQFYWDSYFTIVGLAASGQKDLALGMIKNLIHQQKRFGYIPNSNNKSHGGRSQPPFLSSMVLTAYAIERDHRWLESSLKLVEAEYHTVWLGHTENHKREVHRGLSRYFSQSNGHFGAEEESGWDYANRFNSEALDYLPIDLNALLFKYEVDIAAMNEMLGHASPDWYRLAERRAKTINDLMWNEEKGLFFDYNYKQQKQGSVASLAAYLPMFAGLATSEQASALVNNLSFFQTKHGLTTTAIDDVDDQAGRQWMSPNGWAPLHFLVVEGLRRYGYEDEAKKIARAWVETVNNHYLTSGFILEKYNVVDPSKPPKSAVYPDQVGFAWTNSITLHFINSYLD